MSKAAEDKVYPVAKKLIKYIENMLTKGRK